MMSMMGPPSAEALVAAACDQLSHECVAAQLCSPLHFYGRLSLLMSAFSMSLLFVFMGACNLLPSRLNLCPVPDDEPCPRAVRWTYPGGIHQTHRHWFLVHVGQTRLLKDHYVNSVSQYVGARGTSGAKLMLMACTGSACCQIHLAYMLWRVTALRFPDEAAVRWLLMWLSAAALILLGMAESAIDWKDAEQRLKDGQRNSKAERKEAVAAAADPDLQSSRRVPHSDQDSSNGSSGAVHDGTSSPYSNQLEFSSVPLTRSDTEGLEDPQGTGKARMRMMHMVAAFMVVGFTSAGQLYGHWQLRLPSVIVASVGLCTFILFCLMQWLSGVNDELIPDALEPYRAANVMYSRWGSFTRPVCYCPPGFQYDRQLQPLCVKICDCISTAEGEGEGAMTRSHLHCASWWFICVEVVAFLALTGAAGVEAVAFTCPHYGTN